MPAEEEHGRGIAVVVAQECDETVNLTRALERAGLSPTRLEPARLDVALGTGPLRPADAIETWWLITDGDWDALTACRRVSESRPNASIVVVVDRGATDVTRLVELGASDFIERPVNGSVVDARVVRLLRERAQHRSLQGQVQQFRSIISNIPGTVYRCEYDQGWTMQFINDEVETLSGYPASDFLAARRDYASIMHPDDRDRAQEEVGEALDADRAFILEYRVIHADGSVHWVSSRGQGIRDSTGQLMFLDGAIFDITETKHLQRRLDEQRSALETNNEELSRLHEIKDRMFQNVSHELRTPLSLILAPLEQMLEPSEPLDARHRARLESMRRHGLRLLGQINDMLDLAKLGSGEPGESDSRSHPGIDVRALCEQLVQDVRYAATSKQIVLRFEAVEPPVVYRVEARHFEKILLNLLSNALKFTPPRGTITVTLADDDRGMTLSVRDTGIGIEPSARARIFERFEQADSSTTRRYGGTGIGLSLVAELVASMEGTISVQSEPGQGSCFFVSVPATRRAAADTPSADASPVRSDADVLARRAALAMLTNDAQSVASPVRAGDHGPRVLIAEDDPGLNAALVELLESDFRIVSVGNGTDALRLAGQFMPHVIVSDVMMPGMDGLELAAAIREQPAFRETAIVLLSARGQLHDRVKGRKAGVDSYLTKPFSPRELRATIEGLLRSRMRVVGSYLVHESIGSGGQAEVFLAEERASQKLVALKLLSADPVSDTDARARLQREREILTKLRHPNIVRVIEHGQQQGSTYVAMEYLEGATVDQILRANGKLTASVVATIARQVAAALGEIHRAGLVHRDVKCSNVMVLRRRGPPQGRVKLIDFGVVDDRGVAAKGLLVGTLPYLAPEVLSGNPPSEGADIYALGVSMYRALTGSYPYHGREVNPLLEAIGSGPPTGLEADELDLPAPLVEVVLRALAREPDERWPSAAALEEALAPYESCAEFEDAMEIPAVSNDAVRVLSTVVSEPSDVNGTGWKASVVIPEAPK